MLEHMFKEGFLTSTDKEKTLFSENLGEIENFISNYKKPEIRKYV